MSNQRRNALREEIVASVGEAGLKPPIENLLEPLWDAKIGSEQVDVFRAFESRSRYSIMPDKLLAAQGVNTLRDAAIIGGAILASAPGVGSRAIAYMWRSMRNLKPSMPLPFEPDMETIVGLSLGDLGRVPVAAAAKKWLPEDAVGQFANGRPTVGEMMTRMEDLTLPVMILDAVGQHRLEDDVSSFASRFSAYREKMS